ncbi:MAG: polysaccharide deacetylase family protein [Clostridia bacterium]|nr:polysaccharide deacetylase family protein [Clostridia bacterium]
MAGFMANQLGMRMLAPARRISKVAPIPAHRACALVFDESPCAVGGVTEAILQALRAANAHATFAVYGSTAENYPDRRGKAEREAWRGVRYAHLPDFEADEKGGALAHPELLRAMVEDGNEVAVAGYRFLSATKTLFSRRKVFADAVQAADDLKRILALTEAAGIVVDSYLPPFDAVLLADNRSLYDVCNALGLNLLAPSCDYSHAFFNGTDADAEAKRIVRSVKARLQADPTCFDGRLLRFNGGLSPKLHGKSVMPQAIAQVLALLSEYGYDVLSVRELLARSPFEDLSPDDPAFASAKALLERGYTVACRGNRFRPDASVTRESLYAMLVPRQIMRDYMESRLYRSNAAFALNQKSEKEFYMSPGTAVASGMFYGYEVGWPMEHRQHELTTRAFAAFLEKAAPKCKIAWTAPNDAQLRRKNVIDALWQFISEEEAVQNGQE